jgi:hypothetical protein
VEAILAAGGGALVQVDSSPFAPGIQQHWVDLEEVREDPRCAPYNAWDVFDPWHGEMVEAGSYYAPYGRALDYAVWAIALYAAG